MRSSNLGFYHGIVLALIAAPFSLISFAPGAEGPAVAVCPATEAELTRARGIGNLSEFRQRSHFLTSNDGNVDR